MQNPFKPKELWMCALRNALAEHSCNVSFYRGHILINVSSGEGRISTPPEADPPLAQKTTSSTASCPEQSRRVRSGRGDRADKEMPPLCRSRRCLDRSVQRTDLQTPRLPQPILHQLAHCPVDFPVRHLFCGLPFGFGETERISAKGGCAYSAEDDII
jgi:hypothetical protein